MTIIILPTLSFFFAKHAENLIKIMFQYSIGGKEMIFKRDPPIPLAMHMTEYEKKKRVVQKLFVVDKLDSFGCRG